MRDSRKASVSLKEVFEAAWPICVGYFAIGVAFGVLAQKAGLKPLEIGLMSVFVFAGSAQFIAVSMLSSGAAAASVILTTFVVNIRHLLMSSSLAVHLNGCSRRFLFLYAYGITDESFAVNTMRFREGRWNAYNALAVNHIANVVWVGSTVAGGFAGQFIPGGSFGIDYALSAMFISLLVLQTRGGIYVITAILAGGCSVLLSLFVPGNMHVIVASLFGATAAFGIRAFLDGQRGGSRW